MRSTLNKAEYADNVHLFLLQLPRRKKNINYHFKFVPLLTV